MAQLMAQRREVRALNPQNSPQKTSSPCRHLPAAPSVLPCLLRCGLQCTQRLVLQSKGFSIYAELYYHSSADAASCQDCCAGLTLTLHDVVCRLYNSLWQGCHRRPMTSTMPSALARCRVTAVCLHLHNSNICKRIILPQQCLCTRPPGQHPATAFR